MQSLCQTTLHSFHLPFMGNILVFVNYHQNNNSRVDLPILSNVKNESILLFSKPLQSNNHGDLITPKVYVFCFDPKARVRNLSIMLQGSR